MQIETGLVKKFDDFGWAEFAQLFTNIVNAFKLIIKWFETL